MAKERLADLAVLGLAAANLFLHKPISDVCDAAYTALGRPRYEFAALLGVALVSAALAALGLRLFAGGSGSRASRILPILGLLLVSAAAQRWLLVSNIELIHYPQYGLLTGLLLAAGRSPGQAWLGATAIGVGDEVYQFAVIYRGRPNVYLDFNDMLLNAIGAAWAVVLFRARAGSGARGSAGKDSRLPRTLAVGSLAALGIALVLAPPGLPILRRAATGRWYRILSPGEAILGAWIVWGIVVRAIRTRPSANGTAPAGS